MSKKLTPFKFKKFYISHEKCAMKVGVDGVLIGAWTNVPDPKEILDIGTGSGLISLMMQQKYPNASITSIEPNKIAFEEAKLNFNNYVSDNKPEIIFSELKDFHSLKQFDLIISNPPFFEEIVSSGDLNRDQARQAKFLPLKEFIHTSSNILSEKGFFNFIYPTQQTEENLCIDLNKAEKLITVNTKAIYLVHYGNNICDLDKAKYLKKKSNLYLANRTLVFPAKGKNSKRTLFSFTKTEKESYSEELIIKNNNGDFTKEYKELTKDFYINF